MSSSSSSRHRDMSWSQVLAESRAFREHPEDTASSCSSSMSMSMSLQAYFPLVETQLRRYLHRMERATTTTTTTISTCQEEEEDNNNNNDSMKQLILDTRNALRFGLSCFSFPDSGDDEQTMTNNNNDDDKNSENDKDCRHITRQRLQNKAIANHWHECLCRLLCHQHQHPKKKKKKMDIDVKCQLYAARLLSNVVTKNVTSATAVVTMLTLTPTHESILSRIQQETIVMATTPTTPTPTSSFSCDDPGKIHNPATINNSSNSNSSSGSNWLDMLLIAAKCHDRNVLAAVVATLHNCIASVSSSSSSSSSSSTITPTRMETTDTNNNNNHISNIDNNIPIIIEPPVPPFHEQVAQDNLIIATLLRQVISTNKMIQHNQTAAATNNVSSPSSSSSSSCADVATEWILMLLLQLFRLGLLPQLYAAAAGGATAGGGGGAGGAADCDYLNNSGSMKLSVVTVVVPEQLVLLHCLIKGIEDEQQEQAQASTGGGTGGGGIVLCCSIFGDNPDHAVDAHLFLARVFINVRHGISCLSSETSDACPWWLAEKSSSNNNNNDNNSEHDYALERSLLLIILDIMGETLSADTAWASRIRTEMACPRVSKVATEITIIPTANTTIPSTLMQTILMDLGQIVDTLLVRNNQTTTTSSTSVRDFVMLESEQRVITILVRVIGNLCFQCRQHQDLMRTTLVPGCCALTTDTTPATSITTTTTSTIPRTGLHVLLSCTSFAHACFTLREWSIVAIRNALHENHDNQAVVADLEAQQPVQSATLESMGISLDLDNHNNNNGSYKNNK